MAYCSVLRASCESHEFYGSYARAPALCIPEYEVAAEVGCANLVAVWPVGDAEHFGRVPQHLCGDLARLVHIPDAHGAIPRSAGQRRVRGAEAEARDWSLVARQNVDEPARLERPHVDAERVARAGADDLSGRVHRDARELDGGGRGHGAEVAVAQQVEGAHGAVDAAGDERVAAADERDARDGARVLGKGDEAEAGG
jgi:hypothetical protein